MKINCLQKSKKDLNNPKILDTKKSKNHEKSKNTIPEEVENHVQHHQQLSNIAQNQNSWFLPPRKSREEAIFFVEYPEEETNSKVRGADACCFRA